MDVEAILALLPDGVLADLALETKVNRYSKKLQAEVIFKLLLHCILSHKDNSLRTMESAYESMVFGLLNSETRGISHSSISERLSSINVTFFEKLYETCVRTYGRLLEESATPIIRFDSTIVTLSGQLLKVGYQIKGSGGEHLRQLKFTVGLSELPAAVKFYHEQKYTGENSALKEAIISHQPLTGNPVRIFDRGISARKTYDELTGQNIPFISRLGKKNKHEVITENAILNPIETDSLSITSDCWIYLFSKYQKRTTYPIRCVKGIQKTSGEEIAFITNIHHLTAEDISVLYKKRWDVEVFFKFLKQELNFSHLINRSENGIKVVLYATLIASILLLVYKKKNKLSGYKIMKLRFVLDLEKQITKDIVFMCGGNPDLVDKLFSKPPS
jgi:hypothetical protein